LRLDYTEIPAEEMMTRRKVDVARLQKLRFKNVGTMKGGDAAYKFVLEW